jgi:uncharacterized protein YbcI
MPEKGVLVLAFFLRATADERCGAMKIADTQNLHADLSQALGEFWKGFAGFRAAHGRVVAGERALAVLLDEVLSPAEQQITSSETGRKMLQELGERVM